jgi:hypothetical protein
VLGLPGIALLGGTSIDGDKDHAAPPLDPVGAVALVLHVVSERGEEEPPEPPPRGIDIAEEVTRQGIAQKTLGEVLGLLGGVALTADEGLERIPVAPAEL